MPRLADSRTSLLEALGDHYGLLPWPGSGSAALDDLHPFEALLRVGLELIAEPRVAASARGALHQAGMTDPTALAEASSHEIDQVFQQARVRLSSKALKPLQKLARWFRDNAPDRESLEERSTESIRDDWRALNGVGPATADAWLLFGLRRPTFPVDRASYRIFVRHGWLDPSTDYDEARATFESVAPDSPDDLGQLSLGLEKLGRDACKPSGPRCEGCPLQHLLPESGPVATDT